MYMSQVLWIDRWTDRINIELTYHVCNFAYSTSHDKNYWQPAPKCIDVQQQDMCFMLLLIVLMLLVLVL